MIHYRLPVHGIDRAIQDLQNELHERLLPMWYLGEDDYQCYGRCQRTPFSGGYAPRVHIGEAEYRDVSYDDRYAVQSFFGLADNYSVNGPDNVGDVHLIVFVHLGRIKIRDRDDQPVSLPMRADMEVRNAVQLIMGQDLYGFTLKNVVSGPEATKEYQLVPSGSAANATAGKFDMHPFHVFRINGTLRWPKPQFNNYNFFN